jgi:hypothetical protein
VHVVSSQHPSWLGKLLLLLHYLLLLLLLQGLATLLCQLLLRALMHHCQRCRAVPAQLLQLTPHMLAIILKHLQESSSGRQPQQFQNNTWNAHSTCQ